MKYEVHLPPGVPYLSFVVEYDPYTEEVDKVLTMAEALEWAQVVKDSLGIQDTGSHMADAAQVNGARVAPPPQQPPRAQAYQPQQAPAFVDHTQTYVCDRCNGAAVLGNVMKTAKMKRPAAPVKCANGCMDGQYAHTVTWQDA